MFSLLIIWIMESIFSSKNFYFLDSMCAVIVSLIIIKAGWKIIKESIFELLYTLLNFS